MLMKGQKNASPQRGLPTDDKGTASTQIAVTGETVLLYYSNAGVHTIDAGQAIGVAVVGKLAYDNIKNVVGNMEGIWDDTSLSFTSTALTTRVEVNLATLEGADDMTFALRLAAITDGMSNGDYFIDHATGTVYGKKASTTFTLTSTAYTVQSGTSAPAGSTSGEVEGDVAHDAADSGKPVKTGGKATAARATAVDENDRVQSSYDLEGQQRVVVEGDIDHDAVDSGAPVKIGGYASSVQAVAVAAADRVNAVFNLFGEIVHAGYDWITNSNRATEINPLSQHFVGETIVDVTNETDATTNYFIDMAGFSGLNLQLVISGGSGTMTVTLEVSAQDDGTAAASVTYVDVTNDVFGSASFIASTFLFDDARVLGGVKFVKIKTVSSTGGANDADITIYSKKLY